MKTIICQSEQQIRDTVEMVKKNNWRAHIVEVKRMHTILDKFGWNLQRSERVEPVVFEIEE